mgnify:CR=1 FL=1
MTVQTPHVSGHDVVSYIKEQLPEASAMQRHKLAYYAQAWHATWEGGPLFPERIEAWEHGPVVRVVWSAEKYGPMPRTKPLSPHARGIVDAVIAFYGHMSAATLRALTHMEAPWITARHGLPEGAPCSEAIPLSDMRRFYTRKSVLREQTPTRPIVDEHPPLEDTLRMADEEIVRWREALDKLAQ